MSSYVEQIDGNSPEYEAFVAKFRARKTSDDTFTPPAIYAVVRDWAVRRYGLAQGTPIVRPFWPGGDYTRADYPAGCVVIDNPPFSVLAKIVRWYNERKIRFFLFAPGLTSLQYARDGVTAYVCAHYSICYANGARVNTSFITNLEQPDVLAVAAGDLRAELKAAERSRVRANQHVNRLTLPDELVTGARLGFLAAHGVAHTVRRSDATFVRKLDNYDGGVFGGGFLLSRSAAAEIAAKRRSAWCDDDPANGGGHWIELSPRERAICDQLGGR